MSVRDIRKFVTGGEEPSAAELELMRSTLARLENISISGNLQLVHNATGIHIAGTGASGTDIVPFKLNGSLSEGGTAEAKQQQPNESTGFEDIDDDEDNVETLRGEFFSGYAFEDELVYAVKIGDYWRALGSGHHFLTCVLSSALTPSGAATADAGLGNISVTGTDALGWIPDGATVLAGWNGNGWFALQYRSYVQGVLAEDLEPGLSADMTVDDGGAPGTETITVWDGFGWEASSGAKVGAKYWRGKFYAIALGCDL